MRRDYFTLDADGVRAGGPDQPTLSIAYGGPSSELEARLKRGEDHLDGGDVDVAYRLRDRLEDEDPAGVLAIADRVTGEYVLELNTGADAVLDVVDAARETTDGENEGRYRIVIETEAGDRLAAYEKSTLLVYDADGGLLRDRSLIPSGVEI